jgi:hypothetical protein
MSADGLTTFTVTICNLCLNGEEGECHTPGCVFWVCPAPNAEQAWRLLQASTEGAA